jgi:hypothetical protein
MRSLEKSDRIETDFSPRPSGFFASGANERAGIPFARKIGWSLQSDWSVSPHSTPSHRPMKWTKPP